MLFGKKPVPETQSDSMDNRRAPRYSALAQVRINGFEGQALLRNINQGGFCMESRTYAAITLGDHYTMEIIPESATNLRPFKLDVEVRWVRSTEKSFNSGFLILTPPADRSLERYVAQIIAQNQVIR
jgi:hypothetical protein